MNRVTIRPAFLIENSASCFSVTERILPNLWTFQRLLQQMRDGVMRLRA